MGRNLILDLEGVLIESTDNPAPHPEAGDVLFRANTDFKGVFLWTRARADRALKIIEKEKWLRYFQVIIGKELVGQNEEDYLGGIYLVKNGRAVKHERRIPKAKFVSKDITALGNPGEYVLIEDEMRPSKEVIGDILGCFGDCVPPEGLIEKFSLIRNGSPQERVVYVQSYTSGMENHSLVQAYEQALRKFER